MYSILFICTGNTCRSPMAEWLLKKQLEEQELTGEVAVESAGLFAGTGSVMTAGAKKSLSRRELGEADRHRARQVSQDMLKQADLILTMTRAHQQMIVQKDPSLAEKVYTLREYAESQENGHAANATALDIDDPFGGTEETYESTAMQIEEACVKVTQHLRLKLGKA